VLKILDVSKRFGGLQAVDRMSLDVKAGAVTALIGPNGAGKTTLFNLVAGLHSTDTGVITFNGRRLESAPTWRRAELGIARTFQVTRVLNGMTVGELLLAAARPQLPTSPWSWALRPRATRTQEAALRKQAFELLDRFNIAAVAGNRMAQISGGQRKLVDLARTLMASPELILLDEPAAGVHPVLSAEISQHIKDLCAEGMTFLIIEHNMKFLEPIAEHVVVMAEGRKLLEGTLDEVRRDPEVLEAYLGQ